MKGDKFDNWDGLTGHQGAIPKQPKVNGSTNGKFPVFLDDGKTVIYVSDKKKAKEVIERYKNRLNHLIRFK